MATVNFSQQVTIDGAIANMRKVAENLATLMMQRIKGRSPVDTGRFKGSWEKTVAQDGSRITIDNPVPYAGYLEFGTPKMAPFAPVRTTLLELDSLIAQALSGNTKAEPTTLTRPPGKKHL